MSFASRYGVLPGRAVRVRFACGLPACPLVPRTAFTLIELLVVIAILSLLMTLIMPSLGKARLLARSTVCLTNLHNIHTLSAMYISENNDYLFPVFTDSLRLTTEQPAWTNLLGVIYIDKNYPRDFNKMKEKVDTIFYCPQKPVTEKLAGIGGQDGKNEHSYGANWGVLKRYDYAVPPSNPGVYERTTRWQSALILIGDSAWEGSPTLWASSVHQATANSSIAPDEWIRYWNYMRHPGGVNVLRFDGCAQTRNYESVLRKHFTFENW